MQSDGRRHILGQYHRLHAHQSRQWALGPEEAITPMEHLPPVGWANIATMDGIDARIEFLGAHVTGQLRELDAHVTGQLRELDVHVTGQIAALEGNLLAAMHQAMRMNTLVTIGVLGTLTTVVSAITSMG